jgi:hypothetical protein
LYDSDKKRLTSLRSDVRFARLARSNLVELELPERLLSPRLNIDCHTEHVRGGVRGDCRLAAQFEDRSLHSDSVDAESRALRALEGIAEEEDLIAGTLRRNTATVVRDTEAIGRQIEFDVEAAQVGRLTGGKQAGHHVGARLLNGLADGIVDKVEDALVHADVTRDHVYEEILAGIRVDLHIGHDFIPHFRVHTGR